MQTIADREEGNFIFSGLSVHLAMSMCALGAEGTTAREMFNALHINEDTINDFRNFINANFKEVRGIELSVANGIFVDKDAEIKDNFKDGINNFFLSDVTDVDFKSENGKAVQCINNWCAEKTKNKIKQLVTEDDVNSFTKIILTNAVHFKASWLNEFEAFRTRDKIFHIDMETKIKVPTMHSYERFRCLKLDSLKAKCVEIPYTNSDYAFVIIRPEEIEGLKELEMNLSKIQFNYNEESSKNGFYKNIYMTLPKFKIENTIKLNKYLEALGMAEMFGGNANFLGISENSLFVNKVLQKALINVDEVGTEASASCYEDEFEWGEGPKYHKFKVNRPFLYKIVKRKSNLTLFSGRVVNPML